MFKRCRWQFILLSVLFCIQTAHATKKEMVFDLDIPITKANISLKILARQSKHALLFKDDQVKSVITNAISGQYSLNKALDALLKNTTLSARLTKKGVITITPLLHKELQKVGDKMIKIKKQSKVTNIFASLLLAVFGTGSVAAEDGSSTREDEAKSNTIIVTATRRETSVQETPISMDVFDGQSLNDKGLVGIGDFIDSVSGITAASSGPNQNRIIIRNVATSTQEGGSAVIATYFDDFSVSPILSGTNDIRLVDMQRVEVLKGPQGTLYGRSAMGGIIRYISNKPHTDGVEGGFSTYYSNTTDGGNNKGGHAYLNLPLSDDFAIRMVGYSYKNDGFIDNDELGIKDFNDETTNGGRVAAHWDATESFSVDFTYLTQDLEGAPNWITTTRDPGDLANGFDQGLDIPFDLNARNQVSGVKMQLATNLDIYNLKLENDFDSFTATFLASQINTEGKFVFDQREFIGLTSGCICDYLEPGSKPNKEKGDIFEFRLVSSGDNFVDWIAGVYLEDANNVSNQRLRYEGPFNIINTVFGQSPIIDQTLISDRVNVLETNEKAVYGEVGFNFTNKTSLTIGVRQADIEFSNTSIRADGPFAADPLTQSQIGQEFKTQENVTTYKLALEHRYTDDLFAYASASSGYRRGGINIATFITPTTTFDSDSLWNYETGIKSTWLDGDLLANASLYYIDYSDIQLVIQDPATFFRATQNAGKASIAGLEFTLGYQMTDDFDISFSGSTSNPELKEDVPGGLSGKKGDRLPGSAKQNFAISINWEKEMSGSWFAFANSDLKYVGSRLNDFNTDLDIELPSYQLVNLYLGARNIDSGLTVSLFANNLFDESIAYYIDRQGPFFESVPTNRPRTVGVNVSYDF